MKDIVQAHCQNIYEDMFIKGDRELTKDSISGSEFGKPIYRIWRERNPDENYVLKKVKKKDWETQLPFTMGAGFGTAAHLLAEHLDEGDYKEVSMEIDYKGLKVTGSSDKVMVADDRFAILDYKFVNSPVLSKVGRLIEDNDLENDYFRPYRFQGSLYSYLFYKTNENFKYPQNVYVSYCPRDLWNKDRGYIKDGEFNVLAELPCMNINEVEERLDSIATALASDDEPEFDCVIGEDCKYCKALCEFNKKCEDK